MNKNGAYICTKFSMKKRTYHWRKVILMAKFVNQYKIMLQKKRVNRVVVSLVSLYILWFCIFVKAWYNGCIVYTSFVNTCNEACEI